MYRNNIQPNLISFLLILMTLFWTAMANAQFEPSGFISHTGQSNITIDGKLFSGGSSGAAIYLKNCDNITITNCRFENMAGVIGVELNNCANIEVANCEFDLFRTGVYAVSSQGVNVHCNSFKDIGGSKPRGQIVQFNGCSGSGNRVNYNTLDHTFGVGYPEDLINMYASSGVESDPLQIIGNHLRGGGPSKSGGGIMVGDNDGHDIIVEDNILVDPGQYGIGCPAGRNIVIRNNKVYGKQQSFTNIGMYVGLSSEIEAGHVCEASSIQVIGNEVQFTKKDGSNAGFWNCSCCSGIVNSGNNFSAGFGPEILPDNIEINAQQCGGSPVDPDPDPIGSLPNGYECYYSEDFETTPIETFADGDYYWPYYMYFQKDDGNLTEFHKRYQIHDDNGNKYMRIIKEYADKDKDNNPDLNPRTELRLRNPDHWDIPKETEQYFTLKTRMTNPESVDYSAEFFQIMGRKGSISPPLQFEVRSGVYKARYWDHSSDNKVRVTIASGHENPADDYDKWVQWELFYLLSDDPDKGYFKMYKDGVLVWERYAPNRSTSHSDDHWLQYGCYVNNGADARMQIEFDDLCLAGYTGGGSGGNNQSPSLSFTAPQNSGFQAGDDLGVVVDASDADGSISSVDLYFNDELVRTEGAAPYEWGTANANQADLLLMDLAEGQHVLKAIATDDDGATTTAEMTIYVDPAGTYRFDAIHDAYIQGGTGYNTTDLRIENDNRVLYLMFDVEALNGPVESATLSLTVGSDAGSGTIRLMRGSHENWTEEGLSGENAPDEQEQIIVISEDYVLGQTYELNVSDLITATGTYTMILTMDAGGNDVSFASSESNQPPVLKVVTGIATTSESTLSQQPLLVYPNPTKQQLHLSGTHSSDVVTIHDLSGRLVKTLSVYQNAVDVSDLEQGVYFVRSRHIGGVASFVKK